MITNFSTSSIRTGVKRKRFWDQSAVANSFFSIATTTLSSNQSTVTFDNIPQTYTHLQFRGIVKQSLDVSEWITFTCNDIGGTSYSMHELRGNGSSASSSAVTSNAYGYVGLAQGNTYVTSFVFDILDYKDTNKFKTSRCLYGVDTNSVNGYTGLVSSNLRTTNAITKVVFDLTGSTQFAQYSSLALYGVLA